ncbi:LTA synthase family protein [Priestia koreensis]|uniref:LTA synthase family protein n=1 Tax=Priestia koreensis TaxID=284581 RepID=UPI001F57F69A|nr:LTA synthase family protein [Priestia koreensis]UNL83605.1 LTA synthase family protein [Priestia koreensis]
MKQVSSKSRALLGSSIGFFILAVVLFWIKTYTAYRIEFNLGIENFMQKFLLFLNPLSSAIFFLAFALLAKGRKQLGLLVGINFVLSFVLYSNIVYYRFFNDFITLPTLTQTDNFGKMGDSVLALMHLSDVFYFSDTIILLALILFKVAKPKEKKLNRRAIVTVFTTAVLVFSVNLALAETDRPQLLTRTFDRNYLVKYLGAYNYTVYDAIQSSKSSAQRALADSSDVAEVKNYTRANYAKPNPEYFGKEKGKNVIFVSLESLQNFMINYKLNGQEVTPFLNSLTKDKNTMYFDNFYHQTGQGKTSDAEFMMENSMFPLPQGSVFSTKGQNTYQASPGILKTKGYTSAVFHGNYKTFWNRDEMYKQFGYDKFFDANYYDMNAKDTLNYGLKDKPFFKESMPYLKDLKQPFYTKFISLSNHFPYPLDEEDKTIQPANTGDTSVDQYFQTARYMDEALKQFFDDLKKSGLYDNSVIVMYGDHYGISENHKKAMAKILGKDKITPYDQAQLQKVPLFITGPGLKGGVNHTYGGQVDVRPTLMHLLGVDTKDYIQFGTDLLSKEHQQIVPFRNGDVMTPEASIIGSKYYNTKTGEQIPEKEAGQYKKYENIAEKKLNLSDKVVYGDLLRFYKPDGFKKINPSDYDYNFNKADKK